VNTRRVFDPWGVAFGVVLPLFAAAGGLLLTLLWESRLPDRIVVHWGSAGPEDYSEPMTASWVFALAIVFVGGGCSAFSALAQALLTWRRIMLVAGLTVTGLLSTLQVAILAVQLDAVAGEDVQLPSAAIALGIVNGFAIGAVGAGLLRDYRIRVPALEPPDPRLPRGAAQPIKFFGGFGVVGLVVLAALGIGGALLACATVGTSWPLWIALPVIVLVLAGLRYDITVDGAGVRVRNLGLTSFELDLEEITGARLTHVAAFKDFGGWGLRAKGPGRYGVITKTGPAVEIGTASGLTLTITSERADAMAGALNTLADQQRG
jgi:hypothetical protein